MREARGLTREALAQKINMSTIFVRKLEAGERTPSLDTLDRLARALGVTLKIELVERRSR